MTERINRKAQGLRLQDARNQAGYRSARDAAIANNWSESTYRAHERGTRTIGQDDAERYARRFRAAGAKTSAQQILFGDQETAVEPPADHVVPIMGRIGAGANIEPDYEQVPEDGIEQVELPFPIADDLIGFRVVGDSMMPTYEPDSIVIVPREQPYHTDHMIGMPAAVQAYGPEGERRRYLKRLRPGSRRNTFTLESINDRSPTIRDVRIIWASPVQMIIPNLGLPRILRKPRRASSREQAARKERL